jgi:predicted short-subunit dehydrogenase-like oxidoreductase (DUF2520 family)
VASTRTSTTKRSASPSVFILGAGKVGAALRHALRAAGVPVTLRPARRPLPRRIDADLVLLAVRDKDLAPLAERIAAAGILDRRSAVVHAAGALDATPLAALRGSCAGVGQMHPMISFASTTIFPSLARGNVHVQGDPVAVARARAVARRLGMTPRTFPSLDSVGYHAAAGLVANGAAALAAAGVALLGRAGVPASEAPKLLGPLLRSVGDNVERMGFPQALTGPVRRGDPSAIEKQIKTLRERLPEVLPLFAEAGLLQIPIARELAEGPPGGLDAMRDIFMNVLAPLRAAPAPRRKATRA